jgi:hypothetical protein
MGNLHNLILLKDFKNFGVSLYTFNNLFTVGSIPILLYLNGPIPQMMVDLLIQLIRRCLTYLTSQSLRVGEQRFNNFSSNLQLCYPCLSL